MSARLDTMTPAEQRAEVQALIAYYDARGLDWIDIVGFHCAVFTGRWPEPKRVYKPRKKRMEETQVMH